MDSTFIFLNTRTTFRVEGREGARVTSPGMYAESHLRHSSTNLIFKPQEMLFSDRFYLNVLSHMMRTHKKQHISTDTA